jgi:hypothetical protein
MALNFGSNTPSAYYLGSSSVNSIYFGDTKVWPFGLEVFYMDMNNTASYIWPTGSNSQQYIGNISANRFNNVVTGALGMIASMSSEAMRYSFTASTIVVADPSGSGRVMRFGNFFTFGGGQNNYLTYDTSNNNFELLYGNSGYSFEMWVRPYRKTTPNFSPLYSSLQNFSLNISTPGTNDGALFVRNKFFTAQTNAQSQSLWTPSGSVTFNQWNHIVLTAAHSGAPNALNKYLTSSLSLYVNGVKMSAQSSSQHMGFAVRSNNNPLPPMIGRDRLIEGGDVYANMDLSQMKIYYNKTLEPTEVLELYDNTKARYIPPALTSMKVLFPMDEFFGPANVASIVTQYFTDSGYSAPTLDVSNLTGSNYTGADLDPNVYQAVYIQSTAANNVGNDPLLANNLKTYIENGGGVLFGPYIGAGDTYNPGGSAFDENLLPYNTKNTTLAPGGFLRNITVNNQHPIINASAVVTGDSTGDSGQFVSYTSANVRPAATLIASLSGSNITYLAAQNYGAGRVAHFNYSLLAANPGLARIANKKLFANSLRWAAKVI